MSDKQRIIAVDVRGAIGEGKSTVMEIIRRALAHDGYTVKVRDLDGVPETASHDNRVYTVAPHTIVHINEITTSQLSAEGQLFEAVPPFHRHGVYVRDANDNTVIACFADDDGGLCSKLYAEEVVDTDPNFVCCECGRLGQRMEEVGHGRCGL